MTPTPAILFHINPVSGVPAYRQLMDQVKYHVASGVLKAGDKLPSIRDLARALTVNPATVVKAYSELEHAGTIEMQHGRGVFVAGGRASITDRQRDAILRPLLRQVAVEAHQVGASVDLVLRILDEENQKLGAGSTARKE